MKYKVLKILMIMALVVFGLGITYSIFNSNTLAAGNQKIAKFIFNAEEVDKLSLPITDLKPGYTNDFDFSVSNSKDKKISDVTIEYQMTIKTFHLVPLNIELYKIDGETETLLITCDETFSRNEDNELVCNLPIEELDYLKESKNNYKLRISFPKEYNDEIYSNLVDYIDIEIKKNNILLSIIPLNNIKRRYKIKKNIKYLKMKKSSIK